MGSFSWREFLRGTRGEDRQRGGLEQTKEDVRQHVLRRSTKHATGFLGVSLAVLALSLGDTWIKNSPLFNHLGAAATLLLLLLCWLTGVLYWLVSGSKEICIWAFSFMPFGIQPYRSASGIMAFFMLVCFLWDAVPALRRIQVIWLVWLRRVLWVIATMVCFVALLVAGSRFSHTDVLSTIKQFSARFVHEEAQLKKPLSQNGEGVANEGRVSNSQIRNSQPSKSK